MFDRFRADRRERAVEAPPEDLLGEEPERGSTDPPGWLRVITGIRAKDKDLYFVLKIENKGTEVMGESTVEVTVPDKVFKSDGLTKRLAHLEPGQFHKESFRLSPQYRTGGGLVAGNVTYFDFGHRDRMTFALPPAKANFFCPLLRPVKADDDGWRLRTATLKRYEIMTKELKAEPDTLFDLARGAVEGLGTFAVEPTINAGLYRGVARYIGVAGREIYAFELQVIGRDGISRMLITALGGDEMKARAMGFRVVDALSLKTRIRESIAEDEG
jgi:hypothetical protein